MSEVISLEGKEVRLPAMGSRLRNALFALGRAITAATTGGEVVVSAAEGRARLDVCWDCERVLKSETGVMWCSVCGCVLNGVLRRKIALATEKCPMGKWAGDGQGGERKMEVV